MEFPPSNNLWSWYQATRVDIWSGRSDRREYATPSAISNERQQLRRPGARTAGYVQHDTVKVEGSRRYYSFVADPEAISAFLQRRLAQEPSGVPKERPRLVEAA